MKDTINVLDFSGAKAEKLKSPFDKDAFLKRYNETLLEVDCDNIMAALDDIGKYLEHDSFYVDVEENFIRCIEDRDIEIIMNEDGSLSAKFEFSVNQHIPENLDVAHDTFTSTLIIDYIIRKMNDEEYNRGVKDLFNMLMISDFDLSASVDDDNMYEIYFDMNVCNPVIVSKITDCIGSIREVLYE